MAVGWGGGMGRTPDELLGMGKVAGGRGRAAPCGVSTDCTSPLTDEHLGHFQTRVTVLEETIIAQLLLNQLRRILEETIIAQLRLNQLHRI